MGIRERVKRVIAEALRDGDQELSVALPLEYAEEPSPVDAKLAEVERQFVALQERLKVEERISREYFDVISRIEKERDQWKEMFFTQAQEHQNAQAMLQKMLADSAANLRASIVQLDQFRVAAGLERIKTPKMLEAIPDDVAELYGEKMRKLAEAALEQTDGATERDRIAATIPASSKEG